MSEKKLFLLPDLGEGLPDAEIVEWLVKVGDVVKLDEPLVSMETAKAVVEVPSPYSGKVLRLAGGAGDVIETGHWLVEVELDPSLPQRAEAQDTGQYAWQCIQMLAPRTQVLCLADLEQQIFDYLPGVGPERVIAIREALKPHEIDLGTQNHRSPDSEILAFGNDILTAKPRGAPYKGVSALAYRPEKPPPNWNHLLRRALGELLKSIRAQSEKKVETIAILVTPVKFRPMAASRELVQVLLRERISTSPDCSAVKRSLAVNGLNLTLLASPNTAAATARQTSTSSPR